MTKYVIIVLCFFLNSYGFSQKPPIVGTHLQLDASTDWNNTFIAREAIRIFPGFRANPTSLTQKFTAKIDPKLIIQVAQSNEESIENRQLTTNMLQGTAEGNLSVTPTGAANYNIPIQIPYAPGISPSVSVNYNSMSGNGLLGYGTHLGAGSSITRINKTIYNSGDNDEVKYDGTDLLALDGQRLVEIGVYDGGREFRTEIESFSRIIGYGNNDDQPVYF